MDGCSLDLAFPTGPFAAVDCQSRGAAEESRRQEKKKARRCRGPQLTYLDGGMNMVGAVSPDKPPKEKGYSIGPQFNPKTGVYEHAPVTEQYNYETFVGAPEETPVEMDNLQAILKDVKGPTKLQSPPEAIGFFGANPDDSNTTASASRRGLTESFQSGPGEVNVIGTEEGYKLEPDFTKAFSGRGAQKAAGGADLSGPSPVSKEMNYLTPTGMMPNSILPVPNVDVFWKENGLAGGQSSFFSQLKSPGGQPSTSIRDADFSTGDIDVPVGRKEVLTKLDKIFARLDDMEAAKTENAQTEVLLFILTGLGIVFLMDVGCRAAAAAVRR